MNQGPTPARIRYWESMKGKIGNGFKKGHPSYKGEVTQEFRERMRRIALATGKKPDFSGRKHTNESKKKMSERRKAHPSMYWLGKDRSAIFTEEYRQKMSGIMRERVASGIHNFWKGGVTKENKIARTRIEYKLWREAVFKRDDWTCQFCKERGGELNADHIKSFAYYPKLRYDVNNGRTLCLPCHQTTETYGNRGNQFVQKAP